MPNESSPLTTLELPIVLDAASRSFMKKAFALACDIHIATLAAVMDGIKGMRASEEYGKAIAMPKGRARNDRLSEIRKNWGITMRRRGSP